MICCKRLKLYDDCYYKSSSCDIGPAISKPKRKPIYIQVCLALAFYINMIILIFYTSTLPWYQTAGCMLIAHKFGAIIIVTLIDKIFGLDIWKQ